jgi:hypothetical protein
VSMQWRAMAIAAGVALLAVAAFLLLGGGGQELPGIGGVLQPKTCPLTGEEPRRENVVERAAIAVKIENASVAYPLSGLEKADLVFEEVVEGGITRFMAVYHCADAVKAGPVRSARLVDPAIMTPITRILAFSGGNRPVLAALRDNDVVMVTESDAGSAMRRIPRPGITSEHTLYADSGKVRRVAAERFDDPPGDDSYSFGDLPEGAKKAATVTITFGASNTVTYRWQDGRWLRSQNGAPFIVESGAQIGVDNILIEEHEIDLSKTIVDPAGNPSVEIADVTGSGRAVLFRDGRAFRGRWVREAVDDPVRFETRSGDEMVLHPGTTWVELVPSAKGEVKGSFSYER